MNPWKGQRELIGAASCLRETAPRPAPSDPRCHGPRDARRYEALAREGGIADRVHFAGFQKDVRPFLEEFDLFVHPVLRGTVWSGNRRGNGDAKAGDRL
jgi:glycosyltransferase involved in cell wall biosynthesis